MQAFTSDLLTLSVNCLLISSPYFFFSQHCSQQLVVCGTFNRSVGSLQTPSVSQFTVRTQFDGSSIYILNRDELCFILCFSMLTISFCGICMKFRIELERVPSVGICVWSLYSSQVCRSFICETFTQILQTYAQILCLTSGCVKFMAVGCGLL